MVDNLVPVNRGRGYQESTWLVIKLQRNLYQAIKTRIFIYFVMAIRRSDLGTGQCKELRLVSASLRMNNSVQM